MPFIVATYVYASSQGQRTQRTELFTGTVPANKNHVNGTEKKAKFQTKFTYTQILRWCGRPGARILGFKRLKIKCK
jgi:hypothetical protein